MLKDLIRKKVSWGGKVRHGSPREGYDMAEKKFEEIRQIVTPYTMTSTERMYALYKALEYITSYGIPGAVVECGVWRGGSAMLCALALNKFGDTSRIVQLYDTFEGMPLPGKEDIRDFDGRHASVLDEWKASEKENKRWLTIPLSEVKKNMELTKYPSQNILFVEGMLEETLPATIPAQIALLRLDVDWYAPTLHALKHLFPKISRGGVLIVDDYGYWRGARQATDEYLKKISTPLLLNRIDDTGRIGIKYTI